MIRDRIAVVLACLALAACGASRPSATAEDGGAEPPVRLAPEIGRGDGTPSSVSFTEIATAADGLRQPRDLAFNPRIPDELWIVNHDDDSTVIVHDASTDARRAERRKDGYALHFMAEVTALAFGGDETSAEPIPGGVGGKPGTFATCGESRNTYNGAEHPNDFMGATLWSSDLTVYARYNPNGLGSHLDMLHCSPRCMGLAHEEANVYWAFAGMSRVCNPTCTTDPVAGTASIVKYDFKGDDGVGNDDHSDGEAYQYATGQVAYVEGVPSHLAYDANDGMLYIADTGNARIARLDTRSGRLGARLRPYEPMAVYRMVDGATVEDVVPASAEILERPSGIELHGDFLYVTDNATGRIFAFTRAGERVNELDTGLPAGALAGLAFGPDEKVYLVDRLGDRVLRIEP